MGTEISGISGRGPQEALDTGRAQQATAGQAEAGAAQPQAAVSDQVRLSNKAADLQALEKEIAKLPVVDTQRVQDVQRTIATGSYQAEPAQVADKLLRFEAGLGAPR